MSFFNELKRRNVFKVAAAYAAVAWMLLQLSALALNAFSAPSWVMKVLIFLVVVGFAAAVLLAWALELTPEGFKLTPPLEAGMPQSAPVSRKLTTITIAALVLTLAVVVLDAYVFDAAPEQAGVAGSDSAVQEISVALTAAGTAGGLMQVDTSPAADEKSLAILPFENLSSDPEQEYFADGLTEELINTLAEVDGLLVTGRTSAFYFKNSAQSLDQYEIYVRPFPNVNDDRVQVSNAGGRQPLWSRDGAELFYITGDGGTLPLSSGFSVDSRLMGTRVETGEATFTFSARTAIMDWPYFYSPNGRTYDVAPDGQRFIAIREVVNAPQDAAPAEVIIVQNWLDALERQVPAE